MTIRSPFSVRLSRWIWPAAVGAVALAVRLFFYLQFQESPFFSIPFSDSLIYLNLSDAILQGSLSGDAWFMSPLYPYILALLTRVFGETASSARILQILASTGSAILLLRILETRVQPGAARFTALLFAVYPALVFHDHLLLTESFTVSLMVVLLWFWNQTENSHRKVLYGMGGLAAGLLIVQRAVFFLPVLLVAGLQWKKSANPPQSVERRGVVVFIVTAVLVVAPWVIRNLATEGVLVPITASGGWNFYVGNNPTADGMYNTPVQVDLYQDLNGKRFLERKLGHPVTTAEASDHWFGEGWNWVMEKPGRAVKLTAIKTLLFFHPGELDQMGLDMEFVHRNYAILPLYGILGFPVLLILAILGTLSRWKDPWTRRWVSLFLAVLVTTVLFFVNGRLRLPAIPVLFLLAGFGIEAIFTALRSGSHTGFFVKAGCALAAGIGLILLQPKVTVTYEQEYLRLGQMAFDRGSYQEAAEYFSQSLKEKPTFWGFLNSGNAHAALGQEGAAESRYAEALRINPDHYLVYFNLGNLALRNDRPQLAFQLWNRTLKLEPTFTPALQNCGLLIAKSDRPEDAIPYLKRFLELEKDPKKTVGARQALDRLQFR